jgi:hypothetical protein
MILLFNHIQPTLKYKIAKFVELVEEAYGSDFYSIQGTPWLGDNITIEALLPSWILKEYEENPTKVLIVPILKNYLRWLFSLEYGYGAQLEWEKIRTPVIINSKLLQGIAEGYFPGSDFSSEALSDSLQNVRKFSIQVQTRYFDIKGTNNAIKYALTELLGYDLTTTKVYNSIPCHVVIKANILEKHKNFIEEHLVPAGIKVLYESV